jgi:hypothetical protein
MITITTRDATPKERQEATPQLPSGYKRFGNFVMGYIVVVALLLIPMLTYDRFEPVASNKQAAYCIIVLIVSFLVTRWLMNRHDGKIVNQPVVDANFQVEVIRVKTTRAIKREDPEDFGVAYYVDVTINGQPKVLFLWGPYFDVLEDHLFPNTEFEIVRKSGSNEFIDFITLGSYFKEEKVLPPFDKAVWESGSYPFNGDILDQRIEDIT